MANLPEKDEFVWKLLDHVFDASKTLLTLFVRIVPIYLALVAVFYATLAAGVLPEDLVAGLRFVCIAATVAMIAMLFIFHYVVQRGVKLYCQISYELCAPKHTAILQRVESRIRFLGYSLLIFGLAALVLIFVALTDTVIT